MERLSDAFRRDHQRWEQVLAEVERRVGAGEWAPALAGFAAFREGMEMHMAAEEQCVFPALEAPAGPAGLALTQALRKGHRDLRVFFDEVQDAAAARDQEEFRRIARTMRALLRLHNEKEEAELYPAAESLPAGEASAAVARLARP